MSVDAALRETLEGLRPRLAAIAPREPCWLIGSAAAVLAGVAGFAPRDVDLLMGRQDAEAFIAAHGRWIEPGHVPADGDRFRSRFARFRFGPLPVEVMGGLEVLRDGAWHPVRIAERLAAAGPGVVAGLPSLREQLRLFEWFGRDKDLDKAGLIRRHLARERTPHAA